MLQQRGGRQYDSSLVGAPPPPPHILPIRGRKETGGKETGSSSSCSTQQLRGGRHIDSSLVGGEEKGEEIYKESDIGWCVDAYNNRRVLHMICKVSGLPLCRASRSSASQLAQPAASGDSIADLKMLGKLSGEVCRSCECRYSPAVVGRIRTVVPVLYDSCKS